MNVAVWDTYVTKDNGEVMHFDIVVPETMKDEPQIYAYGKEYLKSKSLDHLPLTAKESRFCHVESAKAAAQSDIAQKGYSIVEMEGCN